MYFRSLFNYLVFVPLNVSNVFGRRLNCIHCLISKGVTHHRPVLNVTVMFLFSEYESREKIFFKIYRMIITT